MNKLIILLLVLFVPFVAFGQKYTNKKYNFAVKFPSNQGWSKPEELTEPNEMVKKPIKLIVLSGNNSKDKKIIIQIIDNKDNISMDSRKYREGFKSAILNSQNNIRLVSEKIIKHAGVTCYQLTFIGLIQGKPTFMRMMALNANRNQYNLIGISSDTTKKIDPSLDNILTSFIFTKKIGLKE